MSIFLRERGESQALEEAWGRPWLGLGSLHPVLPPPATQVRSQALLLLSWAGFLQGGGLGWASCPSLSGRDPTGRECICNRPVVSTKVVQEELPLQEEGRRSAAHIRPCLFLPDAVERCPSRFVIAGRGLSFTLGQVPWRTLVCGTRHMLRGTQSLHLAPPPPPCTHTDTQSGGCGTKQPHSTGLSQARRLSYLDAP